MSNQGYYNQAPQYPPQSYGGGYPPQGYPPQGYPPQQPGYGYNQGPPMQYQQGPPQQVIVKQKKDRNPLTACLAILCCCCVAEEGCECCADCCDCAENCC